MTTSISPSQAGFYTLSAGVSITALSIVTKLALPILNSMALVTGFATFSAVGFLIGPSLVVIGIALLLARQSPEGEAAEAELSRWESRLEAVREENRRAIEEAERRLQEQASRHEELTRQAASRRAAVLEEGAKKNRELSERLEAQRAENARKLAEQELDLKRRLEEAKRKASSVSPTTAAASASSCCSDSV